MKPAPAWTSDVQNAELWQALLKAQQAVDSVRREGKNSGQNYSFATAEGVMREARSRLHPEGLVLTFTETDHAIRETQRTDKRTGEVSPGATVATVRMIGLLVHAKTGQQHRFTVSGEGADYGDKSVPKAYTNAVKYGCRHLLLIPFGDDPETDSPQRGSSAAPARRATGSNLASDKQAAMLFAKSKAAGMDDETLLKALAHVCGSTITRCDEVPRSKVDDVVEAIGNWEAKRKAAA